MSTLASVKKNSHKVKHAQSTYSYIEEKRANRFHEGRCETITKSRVDVQYVFLDFHGNLSASMGNVLGDLAVR